jgi:hypothetical protein
MIKEIKPNYTKASMAKTKSGFIWIGRFLSWALLFVLQIGFSVGQDMYISTLAWNSSKATNKSDNSSFTYACTFVSRALGGVEWVQGGGKHVNKFQVVSVDGKWPSIAKDGSLTLQVSDGAISGEIGFSRSSGQYSVRLKLFVNGKLDQDYDFMIANAPSPTN